MTERTEYTYLIVGGGMAADAAARGIRELDPTGRIGILAQESTPPADRPSLSKDLWNDPDQGVDDIWLNTEADTGAVLHSGVSATDIDREARVVATDSGESFGYDRLLLATGSAPKRLDLLEDPRVLGFRSVHDYERLRSLSGAGRHVVVIGGGFIATEIAAALVGQKTEVSLVFPDEVLGGHTFPADLARHIHDTYLDRGVHLVPGTHVEAADVDGERIRVRLSSGESLECDAVVEGVGVTPNVDLAERAGLAVDDGVVVDRHLRTQDENIFAAGDVASYPDRLLGRRRVEHVDQATESGKLAGRNLAGADEPYEHTPFFYSDLFDDGYEAVGDLDAGLETVTALGDGQRVVYYVDGPRVVGVLLWNVWDRVPDATAAIAEADASDVEALRQRIPVSDDAD
jgi:3-phenylpropionate/trans-cinnamate dioxygenase ferredoxin reductase subunit